MSEYNPALEALAPAELRINPVFQAFIAPLSDDELDHLEESILREGVRDPIVVWNSVILDGHHRYGICLKHKLPFRTHELTLTDEEAAKLWMIDNQLGRRNVSAFYRCELALAKEAILKEQGRAAMSAGGKESARLRAEKAAAADPDTEIDRIKGLPKLSNLRINTRGQLAFECSISAGTFDKVKKILQHGSPDVIASARHDDISIHQAYQEVRAALRPSKPTPKEPTADDRYRKLHAAVKSIYTPEQIQYELQRHTEKLLRSFCVSSLLDHPAPTAAEEPETTVKRTEKANQAPTTHAELVEEWQESVRAANDAWEELPAAESESEALATLVAAVRARWAAERAMQLEVIAAEPPPPAKRKSPAVGGVRKTSKAAQRRARVADAAAAVEKLPAPAPDPVLDDVADWPKVEAAILADRTDTPTILGSKLSMSPDRIEFLAEINGWSYSFLDVCWVYR